VGSCHRALSHLSTFCPYGALSPCDPPAGTLLAFVMLPEVCFLNVPFVPTPEGQYLVKDVVMLFAAVAMGGSVREESTIHQYH
jgi:uncharacterized membrane protein YkgB